MPSTETTPVVSDADTGEDDRYAHYARPGRTRSPAPPCSVAWSRPCAGRSERCWISAH
jgi:hypothetical protein